jgi:protein-tyrosine phosphatase
MTHCTQGKDRTGLVIALILFLLQIPIPAISHDYVLSESELLPERESRLVEIRSIGLTEDFAGCPPEWIEEMRKHLEENYGGVRAYCRGIGFTEEEEERLIRGFKA